MATSEKPSKEKKDTSKVHKLSLKGSAKLVAEFVRFARSISRFVELCSSGNGNHRARKKMMKKGTKLTRQIELSSSNIPSTRSFTSAASIRQKTSLSSRSMG